MILKKFRIKILDDYDYLYEFRKQICLNERNLDEGCQIARKRFIIAIGQTMEIVIIVQSMRFRRAMKLSRKLLISRIIISFARCP